VVLLLSPVLEVRAQTPQTQRYLQVLVPPEAEDQAPVPAGAYNVAAQLLAAEAGVDDSPPVARVHLAGGRWLTLRAARMGTSPAGASRRPPRGADGHQPGRRVPRRRGTRRRGQHRTLDNQRPGVRVRRGMRPDSARDG